MMDMKFLGSWSHLDGEKEAPERHDDRRTGEARFHPKVLAHAKKHVRGAKH